MARLRTGKGTSEQALIPESSDDEKVRNQIEGSKVLGFAKKVVNSSLTLFGVGDSHKGWFIKK
jgi:hypothetical protein